MEKDLYYSAIRRVKLKKKFYNHFTAYVTVNIVMFLIVFFTGGGFSWLPPAMFWGIGLVSHFLKAFGFPGSEEWENKEVEKELQKEMRKYNQIAEVEELELRELSKSYRAEDFV